MSKQEIICKKCNKIIDDKEFRVNFRELQLKPITTNTDYSFHIECWKEHYNESLDKKVQFMAKNILKSAQPMITEFAGRYGG
jgi:hypothetical protein